MTMPPQVWSRKLKPVFRNRFGHIRAIWRIGLYIVLIIGFNAVADRIFGDLLLIGGENPGDFALLLNRFTSKLVKFLCVLIPAIVLLKWLDRRPVALLGMGRYKGAVPELLVGMLLSTAVVGTSALILWLTRVGSFSFNGFSVDMLLYAAACLMVLAVSAAYEEVLFRGYVFQAVIESTNFGVAVLVFALLFGSAHLQNAGTSAFSIAFAVVAGVFLGLLYYRTRALWMAIGAHCMSNWCVGPVLGMATSSPFLRRTIFTYTPAEAYVGRADAIGDGVFTLSMLALTIYLWQARWLKSAESNTTLWAPYPPRLARFRRGDAVHV